MIDESFLTSDEHVECKLYHLINGANGPEDILVRWVRESELGAEIILLAKSLLDQNG